MDSSRIGERDNVPHVLNYPFYSLLFPALPSRPLSLSRSLAHCSLNEHPRRVAVAL